MPSRRTFLRAVGGAATVGGVGFLLSERQLPGTCPPRREPTWDLYGEFWTTPTCSADTSVLAEWFGATGIRGTARLVALTRWSGTVAWARTVTGAGWGRPAVTEEAVYAGTGNESVHAFDRVTGDTLWVWEESGDDTIGGGAWARPAVADGTLYTGVSTATAKSPDPSDDADYDHRVVALDAADGTVRWTAGVDREVFSDLVVVAGVLVVATRSGPVYGFDAADGTKLWQSAFDADTSLPVVPVGEAVAVVPRGEGVTALDAKTGEAVWTATTPGVPTALDRGGGDLFLGDDEGNAASYGLRGGERRWRFEAEASVGGIAFAAADESVEAHVADQIGYVYSVTDAGTRKHRFRISESHSDDRCGWIPSHRRVNDAAARDSSLYVSTRGRIERFSLDFD